MTVSRKFWAKEWLKLLVTLPLGLGLVAGLDIAYYGELKYFFEVFEEPDVFLVFAFPYLLTQFFCITRWAIKTVKN